MAGSEVGKSAWANPDTDLCQYGVNTPLWFKAISSALGSRLSSKTGLRSLSWVTSFSPYQRTPHQMSCVPGWPRTSSPTHWESCQSLSRCWHHGLSNVLATWRSWRRWDSMINICCGIYQLNSSDAGDGIFLFFCTISWLLTLWLPKTPEHQQAWYWLCRTDNMYCCFRVNFIYMAQAKSKIRFKIWIYLLQTLKRLSMLKVNISFIESSIFSTFDMEFLILIICCLYI